MKSRLSTNFTDLIFIKTNDIFILCLSNNFFPTETVDTFIFIRISEPIPIAKMRFCITPKLKRDHKLKETLSALYNIKNSLLTSPSPYFNDRTKCILLLYILLAITLAMTFVCLMDKFCRISSVGRAHHS